MPNLLPLKLSDSLYYVRYIRHWPFALDLAENNTNNVLYDLN